MEKSGNKVRFYTNEYDVEMLEIQTKTRPQYVSLKKALAILDTVNDVNLISRTKKHGRELFKITYKDNDKSFAIGEVKINAVLDNDGEILSHLVRLEA